jgi:hypothetical protein
MDGPYAHNIANLINAHSTLLQALIHDKTIRIDGLPRCHALEAPPSPWNLWELQIGIAR